MWKFKNLAHQHPKICKKFLQLNNTYWNWNENVRNWLKNSFGGIEEFQYNCPQSCPEMAFEVSKAIAHAPSHPSQPGPEQ